MSTVLIFMLTTIKVMDYSNAQIIQTMLNFQGSPSYPELETKLYDELFRNSSYNSYFRPAKQTIVRISLALAAIVELV